MKNMAGIGRRQNARRSGFTLVELLIVLALSVVVLAISARLFLSAGSITFISDFFVNQETQTRYTAERINNAIKFTNALFTIPRKSFNFSNFTESWSYLGMMDNVYIPYNLIEKRNGTETASKFDDEEDRFLRALVYIKYIGSQTEGEEDYKSLDEIKSSYNIVTQIDQVNKNINGTFDKEPYDQYVYAGNVSDGYFLVTIIDYELYDERLGYKTHYDLVFDTTGESGSGNIVTGSLKYSLNVTYLDIDDEIIGEGRSIELETMLNGINILQAVYLGSGKDPATAIAFHEGGFKVDAIPHLNVVFVLDMSGSMSENIETTGGTWTKPKKRIEALAENVDTFIDAFSPYKDTVYVSFVEFETYGKVNTNGSAGLTARKISDPSVSTYVNNLGKRTPSGGTNLGDGFRVAYTQLEEIVEKNKGAANIIIKISDGFTNGWSINKPTIMEAKINEFNAEVQNSKKGSKLSDDLKLKFVTVDEIGGVGKYYWDPYNLPRVILYLDGSTRYVFYRTSNSFTSWSFSISSGSYGKNNSVSTKGDTITITNNGKASLSYTRPTVAQLRGDHFTNEQKHDDEMKNYTIAKDYAAFCLDKIRERGQLDPDYSIAAFYDIYVNAKAVKEDESGMIQDSLQIGRSNTEYYSFTVDSTSQFSECIGRIISNINTAAWLLTSPRI